MVFTPSNAGRGLVSLPPSDTGRGRWPLGFGRRSYPPWKRAGHSLFLVMLCLALMVWVAPARAEIGDTSYRLTDPVLESRAREVGKELRCLVCQNQSIEDSDASLARDLRKLVREQIEAGASNQDAVRFIHARYGDFVLLRPPVNAATLLLWGTPLLALLGGVFAVWRVRRRSPDTEALPLSEAELARLRRMEGQPQP